MAFRKSQVHSAAIKVRVALLVLSDLRSPRRGLSLNGRDHDLAAPGHVVGIVTTVLAALKSQSGAVVVGES